MGRHLPSVYLETTIPSYLAARDSSDLRTLGKQQATREWWDLRRNDFDLYVSEYVLIECQAGDPDLADKRIEILSDIPLLKAIHPANDIAKTLVAQLSLPEKAAIDAAHIAVCVINGIDFLLTWNFTHIANAALRPMIERVCDSFDFECPVICSPEELMEL
jgi:hypothetical protein